MAGLRAVLAIFGASTGFNGEQGADLHGIGVEMLTMHLLSLKQQVVERQLKQGAHFGAGPIMAKVGTTQG